jgi:hypothetical protein
LKKKIVFVVSFLTTVFLLSVCIIFIFNYLQKPKEEYSISSSIRVENKKGALTDSCFNLADCSNNDDEMELKISAGTDEDRQVKYEICFLVEYEQVPFQINKKQYTSFSFENRTNVTIRIKNEYFDRKNNSFIILLRQDTERYAEDSELVSNTSPVILRYSVVKKNGKTERNKEKYMDISSAVIDEEDDMIQLENPTGNKVVSQHVKKAGKFKVSALLGSTLKNGEYLIFVCYNCDQVKVNGNKKVLIRKQEEGKLDLNVFVPEKPGKYEMQIFFVPTPFEKLEEERFEEYGILCSQRQTVYVE